MTQRKARPWVDAAKFFFALCVFLLHSGVTETLPFSGLIGDCIVSVAVPYFFVASGFFLAEKVQSAQQRADGQRIILQYCRRLGVKLLIFEPVSILLWAAKRLLDGMSLPDIALSTLQDVLFYPKGALWYIQAVIIASLLLMPLLVRGWETWAILPALALYAVAVFGTRYRFLLEGTPLADAYAGYERIFLSLRNGLFTGFPFLLLGCLIARWRGNVLAPGRGVTLRLAGAAAASLLLLAVESTLLRAHPGHDGALFFSYLLFVPALFALTAQAPGLHRDTRLLRNLSTSVYLLHSPIVLALGVAVDSPWLVAAIAALIMAAVLIPIYRRRIRPLYGWLT